MRVAYIISILLALSLSTAAQQTSLMFHMGIGTYSMGTQKKLQSDFLKQQVVPVALKATHKFPPYLTYGGKLTFKIWPTSSAGIWYEYGSTGGRLDYSDYSGRVRLDQHLRYSQFGVYCNFKLNASNTWPLLATAHFSWVNTKEKISYEVALGDETDSEVHDFKGVNFGVRPGLMLQHTVAAFVFEGSVGLDLHASGTMKDKAGNNWYLQDRTPLNAQWTGLRMQLGVGFLLSKPKPEFQP